MVTREGIYMAVSDPDEADVLIERIGPHALHANILWRIPAYEEMLPFFVQSFDVSPDGTRPLTSQAIQHSSTIFVATMPEQP